MSITQLLGYTFCAIFNDFLWNKWSTIYSFTVGTDGTHQISSIYLVMWTLQKKTFKQIRKSHTIYFLSFELDLVYYTIELVCCDNMNDQTKVAVGRAAHKTDGR